MKILLVSLLLYSCGIDDEKKTDENKITNEKPASGDSLVDKYPDKVIFRFIQCSLLYLPECNESGDCTLPSNEPLPPTPICSSTMVAENSDCGNAGNRCTVTMMPGLPADQQDVDGKLIANREKNIWPLVSWRGECLCNEGEIAPQTIDQEQFFNCQGDACKVSDLQKGVLAKSFKNGKPVSDKKLSDLETDLLKAIVKDAFENVEKEMFINYFDPESD